MKKCIKITTDHHTDMVSTSCLLACLENVDDFEAAYLYDELFVVMLVRDFALLTHYKRAESLKTLIM
jgi:hypothetical protein